MTELMSKMQFTVLRAISAYGEKNDTHIPRNSDKKCVCECVSLCICIGLVGPGRVSAEGEGMSHWYLSEEYSR